MSNVISDPSSIFTPRAASVNSKMYIRRDSLENRLADALPSNKYIVIHGESGNGKTWLYKQVFKDLSVHYEVINLARASALNSIGDVFLEKLGDLNYRETESIETISKAGVAPLGMGINYESKVNEKKASPNPFKVLISKIRDNARGEKPVLVLDNFESIISNNNLLNELSAIIISADDESIAQYGVQVVIVGVPSNLKELITKLPNATPVANRLTEIPEVARMSESQATDLIKKGLVEELKFEISPDFSKEIYSEICWITDRIAQHIHEFCLILSNNAKRNGSYIDKNTFNEAISTWTQDSLSTDLGIIESVMNARETKAGRKNQVLYAMGQCKSEDFKHSDIEAIVRANFEVGEATLNVSQILSAFSKAATPLIRRTPKQDAWRFASPKLKMAIRSHLLKDENKVSVRQY